MILLTLDQQLRKVNRERAQASPTVLRSPQGSVFDDAAAQRLASALQKPPDPALANYQTSKIKLLCDQITRFISKHDVTAPDALSNKEIKEFYSIKLKILTEDSCKLDKAAEDFLKKGFSDDPLIQRSQFLISSARSWCTRVTELYLERGLHLNTKPLLDTIPVFSPEGKVTIYEFFKLFDEVTGEEFTDKQRASLLYSKHISK